MVSNLKLEGCVSSSQTWKGWDTCFWARERLRRETIAFQHHAHCPNQQRQWKMMTDRWYCCDTEEDLNQFISNIKYKQWKEFHPMGICLFQIENQIMDKVQKELSIAQVLWVQGLGSDLKKNKKNKWSKKITLFSLLWNLIEWRKKRISDLSRFNGNFLDWITHKTNSFSSVIGLLGSFKSFVYVWMTIRLIFARPVSICHVCAETCLFLSHFPTTPSEDISRKKIKFEILVLFLFYSPGYKQLWKIIITKDIDIKRKTDESQENRLRTSLSVCQLLGLESEELV